jgi:hypothetical protein
MTPQEIKKTIEEIAQKLKTYRVGDEELKAIAPASLAKLAELPDHPIKSMADVINVLEDVDTYAMPRALFCFPDGPSAMLRCFGLGLTVNRKTGEATLSCVTVAGSKLLMSRIIDECFDDKACTLCVAIKTSQGPIMWLQFVLDAMHVDRLTASEPGVMAPISSEDKGELAEATYLSAKCEKCPTIIKRPKHIPPDGFEVSSN